MPTPVSLRFGLIVSLSVSEFIRKQDLGIRFHFLFISFSFQSSSESVPFPFFDSFLFLFSVESDLDFFSFFSDPNTDLFFSPHAVAVVTGRQYPGLSLFCFYPVRVRVTHLVTCSDAIVRIDVCVPFCVTRISG